MTQDASQVRDLMERAECMRPDAQELERAIGNRSGLNALRLTGWRFLVGLSLALAATRLSAGMAAREEKTEAAQRAAAEKVLHLLDRGDYAAAFPLADATYRRWRDDYGGRPPPEVTAAMVKRPEFDPNVTYLRSPSDAVLKGAREMANAISKITDAKAVEFLLAMKTPELCLHAYAAAMEIGTRLCEAGRLAEGFAAYHAAVVAWNERKIEPDTHEWAYPRLAGEQSQPELWDKIGKALAGGDVKELIGAYRVVSADNDDGCHWAGLILSEVMRGDATRPPWDKYLPFLAEVLRDKRPSLRKMAAQMINGRGGPFTDWRTVGQMLAPHLDDPDPSVRLLIANAMIRWGDSRGLAVLIAQPLAQDMSPLDYPLMSLGEFNMRQATPWIVELAAKHPEWRQECVRSFFAMTDPKAIEFLGKTLLDTNEPPLTRSLAASALGLIMDDAAFPYMKDALAKADPELADSILASLNGINPELAMPVWIESMKGLGLLGAGDLRGRNLGNAWLQLHLYSGYGDVFGQYRKDQQKLLAGMREYWQGRRKLSELSSRIRYFRFAEPTAEKENAAWRELAEVAKSVSKRSFYQTYELGPPDERDATGRIFRYVSRDGRLLIEQRFTDGHEFLLDIVAR